MSFVLDLTRLSAVYGTRLLAEAGHRVIRIEPATGDDVRRASPFLRERGDFEHGAYHQFLNASKESVVLDPATADGAEALRRLVAGSRLCHHHDAGLPRSRRFLEANPKLALVEVSDVDNEMCAYAASGLLSLTGHPDKAPVVLGGHASLSIIGLYTAIAASAALMCAEIRAPASMFRCRRSNAWNRSLSRRC